MFCQQFPCGHPLFNVTTKPVGLQIFIIIIIGFFINMQVQGPYPQQWAPFQATGLLHAWQISHQISRYLCHEGRRLRASTLCVPLCQLLPSHLGPPRPTLSINLYVKGCLDCTIGAFHISIPAEPSLFQYEVQVFNAEPCK